MVINTSDSMKSQTVSRTMTGQILKQLIGSLKDIPAQVKQTLCNKKLDHTSVQINDHIYTSIYSRIYIWLYAV